jgi:hypothetical protein
MAVRGDEVASAIEAHVREAIEKMVGEIRSSVEDVRDAVDQQLKAALQSVQADVNAISFVPFIQKSIGDLQESIEAERPAFTPAPAAPSGGGTERIKKAIQTIERNKSQVDILNSMLEEAVHFGSRAALLIVRNETFNGWKGVGFTAHGGNDEMVKRFNAAPGLIPELDRMLREEHVVVWDGVNLSTRFGVSASATAVLVPMVIKDKIAAAVYVDAVQDDVPKFDQTAIELLVFTTGLLVDTLAIRKKSPSPTLSGTGESAAAPAAAPPPPPPPLPAAAAPPPRPTPPPAAPAPPPPPPPRVVDEPPESSTVAISAQQMRDLMATQTPGFNVPAAEEFSTPSPRPAPPPPAPPPTAPAPIAPPHAEEGRPSTQYVPPAGVTPRGLGGSPKDEDQKKHDEARRFARLLVSEIKLYNEAKVDAGRKNKDLYERLKEDIDRSRQMYDERIHDDVRKSSNYFYDELVRILADGHADALGL